MKDLKNGGTNTLKRSWKNFDRERCLEKFKRVDWSGVLEENDIDVANANLEEIIVKIVESEAPMSVIQSQTKYNNWISADTKTEMSARDTARETAKVTDSDRDWAEYRQRRNLCTSLQHKDRANYYKSLYSKLEETHDSRTIHSTTRRLLGTVTGGAPSSFLVKGKVVRKQDDMAEVLSSYYCNKVTEIKNTLPCVNFDPLIILKRAFDRWHPPGGRKVFHMREATLKEVSEIINGLKNSRAFGIDMIDAATMKMAGPVIAPAIRHVINLSIRSCRFPQRWKLAHVIPLLKALDSDKTSPSSYRPVAQLPIVSKLTERIIQRQLLTFLEDNFMLARNQHAYRD